jgi:hypothetical protein
VSNYAGRQAEVQFIGLAGKDHHLFNPLALEAQIAGLYIVGAGIEVGDVVSAVKIGGSTGDLHSVFEQEHRAADDRLFGVTVRHDSAQRRLRYSGHSRQQ